MAEAARLLARPYRIRGTVVHGQGRGNKLGYPTANIGQIDTLLPGEGIYAGRAWIDGRPYATAMSLGTNPTFDERSRRSRPSCWTSRATSTAGPLRLTFSPA